MQFSILASGSSGNSILVSTEQNKILIDAGLSGKRILEFLSKVGVGGEEIDAILLTHEHVDHIRGAGVLSRRFNIPIFANEGTWLAAAKDLGKIPEANCKIFDGPFSFGSMDIQPFSISHDAADPVGYVIRSGKAQLGIATDMGYVTEEVLQALKGVDHVILESNHDLEMLKMGPYPWSLKKRIMSNVGHLSNDDAGACVVKLAENCTPCIYLAHLSKDNNIPELAFLTVKNTIEDHGLCLNYDIRIEYTYRDRPTALFKAG
ncbi:metallohydrolase [Anoxybacter fermentans]|uniref:Metallohydrolase n=1 Tax=Anoxybacter fermentans TaxID=1323375 RepID=A0A3Q9HSR2_9FIRM|nr:metallohydrolase [Anoxybacter fermentans]